MTPAQIALSLLSLVAQAAPGLLATITGKANDAEAIAAARAAVAAIPSQPITSALDAHGRGE